MQKNCPICGRPVRINNYDNSIDLLTKYGKVQLTFDYYFCRYCSKGFSLVDSKFKLFEEHKVTLEAAELLTYAGQVAMSFEKASELIFKFTGLEVSESLIRTVTGETDEKVFKQNMERAKKSYLAPEIAAPYVLDKDKKEGVLYIMVDGSSVNTINIDDSGSSWREMKLGLIFADYNRIFYVIIKDAIEVRQIAYSRKDLTKVL